MKTRNLFLTSAFAVSLCFAAEEAAPAATPEAAPAAEQPNAIDACKTALDNASKDIPANANSAKLTLAEAKVNLAELDAAYKDDAESERTKALAANCDLYAKIVATQAETQKARNHIAETWEKRAATARSIEAIQEQINQARSGKVNDLEAEKAKMQDQEARLQAEMQQNQQKFKAEAAAQEAALKAAGEREAELQKKLAEERAKAEARQQEAISKLNELQSQLIQVSKDALILSMSDILFDVNKATLKQDLKTSLAKVAGILSVYQQFNVSIEGNTDNTGSEEHNMKLSQQRADNVRDFLVEQGIDGNRLTAKGLGMTMPVADNSTKEGRQKNRRVDLVIQDKALQQQAQ